MNRVIAADPEDLKKVKLIEIVLMIFIFLVSILVRSYDRSLITFGYLFEVIVLASLFRYHFLAIDHRNFSYWGINIMFFLYLSRIFLHHLFIEFDLMILYITLMSYGAFFFNAYILSSPLYYPRIQWWEYDFRYRGDLKGVFRLKGEAHKIRLIDLRRMASSFEAFEKIDLGEHVLLEVKLNENIYEIPGIVKTIHQDIPGRQFRYGIIIEGSRSYFKNNYLKLQLDWQYSKKVKKRHKFKKS
jgi:hypothetical protein